MVTLQAICQDIDGEEHIGIAQIDGKRETLASGGKYAELHVKAVLHPTGRKAAKEVTGEVKRVRGKKKAALPE